MAAAGRARSPTLPPSRSQCIWSKTDNVDVRLIVGETCTLHSWENITVSSTKQGNRALHSYFEDGTILIKVATTCHGHADMQDSDTT